MAFKDVLQKDIEKNKAILMSDPLWVKYLAEGRVSMPSDDAFLGDNFKEAQKSAANQLATVKSEDNRIANYYELATGQKATPEVIAKYVQYAGDPSLLQAAISKEASTATAQGTYKDTIASTIQSKLGRPPTEAELGYFGKQMEQGNLDAYGLDQFLGGTTEYQTKASDVARGKLATELGGVDQTYLDKTRKALESKYAAAGRSGASAFGSSLIGAAKDIASQRTGYLAGLGYQDFQQGQGNLTAAYQNQLSNMYNKQQQASALGQESRGRYYSNQDMAAQQAAQERLNRLSQPKQGSFLQGLVPGVVQGGLGLLGSYLGRPTTVQKNYYGGY